MSNNRCDKFCDDCFYCGRINGGNEYSRCCLYLLRTNEKRPCDPGKGCTVKVRMKVKRRLKGVLADK